MNRIRKTILFIFISAFCIALGFRTLMRPPVKLYEVRVNLIQNGIPESVPAIAGKLNSATLLHRIIYRLGLNAPIYAGGLADDSALFNSSPVRIMTDTLWGYETATNIKFSWNGDRVLMENKFYPTGKWVNTSYGKLIFSKGTLRTGKSSARYHFSLLSMAHATQKLKDRLGIIPLNRTKADLGIAVRDENTATAKAILMALIYNYNQDHGFPKTFRTVQKPSKTLQDSIAFVEASLLSLEKKEQTRQLQKEKQNLMNRYSQLLQQREHRSLMAIVPQVPLSRRAYTLAITGKPLVFHIPGPDTFAYLEILMMTCLAGIIIILLPGIKTWLLLFKPAMAEQNEAARLTHRSLNTQLIPVSDHPPVKKKRMPTSSGLFEDVPSIPLKPVVRRGVTPPDNKISLAAQFSVITEKLDGFGKGRPKRIAVTSLLSGRGKSFIASNLALSMALATKKTLLIDMDLYLASITRKLAPKPQAGIADYLQRKATLNRIIRRVEIHKELSFISAGKRLADPAALLDNGQVDSMLEMLSGRFENMIIDLPAISLATDAYQVAKFCDVVILAVAGKEEQQEIEAQLHFPDKKKLLFIDTSAIAGRVAG